MTTSPIDPNRVLLTGENPYIRLSETDNGPVTTDASFWRILFSPGGPGHVLFLQSELTNNEPRVYTDNIEMTRWLQKEIQGSINPTFGNLELPEIKLRRLENVVDGDPHHQRRGNFVGLGVFGRILFEPQFPWQQP